VVLRWALWRVLSMEVMSMEVMSMDGGAHQ
jgi:hypothetical protein